MSKQHQNRTEHQRGAAYQLSKESAYSVGLTAPLFQLKASVPLSENPDPKEGQQVGAAILQRKRVAQFDKEKEPLTSDQLEEMLPLLIGKYTQSGEVLVPANTPTEIKYQFYKQIAESQGTFSEDPGSINLISIRGLIMTADGLQQTSSAAAYKEAWKKNFDDPKELKKQHHFSDGRYARKNRKKDIADLGGEGSYDDINIVIHRSKEAKESASESAESSPNEFIKDGHTISVQERKTSVDPGTVGSKYGSAHLRDGQHDYKLGDHGTTTYKKAPKHLQKPKVEGNTIYIKTAHARYAENMFGLTKSKNQVEAASKPDHKTRYPALRIDTDVNFGAIWRAEDKDDSSAAGHFTPERISEIRAKDEEEKDKKGQKTFEGNDLNYHMGGNDSSFSQGCQNVMQSEYKAFIKTFQDAKEKKKKLSFKYTLIDASKIGLKIVKGKIVPRQTDDQRAMQEAIIDSLPKEIPINEMSLPQLSPLPAIESPTTVGPEQTQTQRKIPRQFRSERHQKSVLSTRPIQRDTDPRTASRKIPPGRLIKESHGRR